MYCADCGAALPQQAKYCVDCGASACASDKHPTKERTHLLLEVDPRMVTWVILARYIPQQINLTVLGSLLFGCLIVGYHLWQGDLVYVYQPFIFFALVFFFAVPFLVYISYKKTINVTRYLFYRDRLEYYDGIWNVAHKVVYYKHITEVTLQRNLIQRFYGIGSIHFEVPSMGPSFRGITMADIEHPQQIYDQIQQFIKEY
jgi:uncharacterized membrane protein YdbT with pleckstrin-like domain